MLHATPAKDTPTASDNSVESPFGPPIAPLRTWVRVLVAVLAAAYMAHWTYSYRIRPDVSKSDFGQIWYAAGALLRGENPYHLIGPGLPYDWAGHFYYPLTAAIVALPLAPLERVWADVVFGALSAGALAWVFTRYGPIGVLMLASPSAAMALQLGQWSPLFTMALLVPAVGMLFPVKPTVGMAMFAARPTLWPFVGGAVLLVASFAALHTWPLDWLRALRSTDVVGEGTVPYTAPLLRPGGFVLALAALRWRRPEARLLAVMAAVPQTPIVYETLPLLLVARSRKATFWFVFAGWLVLIVENFATWWLGTHALVTNGYTILLFFYLPALYLVLRRPNEGPAPKWLERVVDRAPAWLRGKSTARQPEAA